MRYQIFRFVIGLLLWPSAPMTLQKSLEHVGAKVPLGIGLADQPIGASLAMGPAVEPNGLPLLMGPAIEPGGIRIA